MVRFDVAIVGGGIVGLATAYQLQRARPGCRVTVLEKEQQVALHQSGRNSGVLHSGIYYPPGSLKAEACRDGRIEMEAFCRQHDLPLRICGKVIVATDASELPRLEELRRRGKANGVCCERVGPERLRELEPHASGVAALHVPGTGVVDFAAVCGRLAAVVEGGGEVRRGARVLGLRETARGVILETAAGALEATLAIHCAGLHADRVLRSAGRRPTVRVVPFRGEYWELRPEVRPLCRALIYPVPDPALSFLGVHFTRTVGGAVECGPNAVLAFAREGYRRRDLRPRDLAETLSYPGFLRLAGRHWRYGLGEVWRAANKRAFVAAARRLVPELSASDLEAAPAGVRAQAVAPDGTLVDDFLLQEEGRILHVANAPSPATTASLRLGSMLAERALARLGGGTC